MQKVVPEMLSKLPRDLDLGPPSGAGACPKPAAKAGKRVPLLLNAHRIVTSADLKFPSKVPFLVSVMGEQIGFNQARPAGQLATKEDTMAKQAHFFKPPATTLSDVFLRVP